MDKTNPFYEEEQKNQLALLENHWWDRHAWHWAVAVKDELKMRIRSLRFYNAKPRFVPQKIVFSNEQFDDLQERADYDRFVMQNDDRQTSFN